MTETECLSKMIAPGQRRDTKWRQGVIQIIVTRACDKSCFSCTQGSNLAGKATFMPPEMFEQAVLSLKGYFGVIGVFGGNPAVSPHFIQYCEIIRKHVPFNQRGLWCNNPMTAEKCTEMRKTFDPSISNLNVHLDKNAYDLFKKHWPQSMPCGLKEDSRHSPPFVAMKDVLRKPCAGCVNCNAYGNAETECDGSGMVYDESRAWELISGCDINKYWSAALGMFRGKLRAWFCEIAAAQSILHQDDSTYPDTGLDPNKEWGGWENHPTHGIHDNVKWWQLRMPMFANQVRKHCHDCGVPLRGHGAKAQGSDETEVEQVSETHKDIYVTKRKGRKIELVTVESQLGQRLGVMTKYLQNVNK